MVLITICSVVDPELEFLKSKAPEITDNALWELLDGGSAHIWLHAHALTHLELLWESMFMHQGIALLPQDQLICL